jgi:hypothetical protein
MQGTRGRPGGYRVPMLAGFSLAGERRLIMMWFTRRLRG